MSKGVSATEAPPSWGEVFLRILGWQVS